MNNNIPSTVMTRDGLALHTRHWPLPEGTLSRGVACIVHGLGEHCGRYEHVAANLNRWGWSVVSYDHRGHGQSPGPRGDLNKTDDLLHDLAAVLDTVRAAYPGQKLLLIGHSLGGLVAARLTAALANPPETAEWSRPIDLLVLSSPALDPGVTWIQKFLMRTVVRMKPHLAVSNGLKAEWVCSDAEEVRMYKDDPLVHDRITGQLSTFIVDESTHTMKRAAGWTVPTLLIYAGSDLCVKPSGSAIFGATVPSSVVTTHGYAHMSHEIFNEPDRAQVFADLERWLAKD